MTRSFRTGFGFLATAALLAGCSTAPTITVPNPLAALNNVFTAPSIGSTNPTYTSIPAGQYQNVPATYGTLNQGYTTAAPTSVYGAAQPVYGAVNQGYATAAPTYSSGSYTSLGTVQTVAAPSYAASVPTVQASAPTYSYGAQTINSGSYSLGSVQTVAAPSYAASVPTVQASAPTYSVPVVNSGSYSLGSVQTAAAPSYSTGLPTLGTTIQPVQASGTTYDLTAPSVTTGVPGLAVDTGYGTVTAPSQGGQFQVVPPSTSLGGGIATYNPAPVTLGVPAGGSFSY